MYFWSTEVPWSTLKDHELPWSIIEEKRPEFVLPVALGTSLYFAIFFRYLIKYEEVRRITRSTESTVCFFPLVETHRHVNGTCWCSVLLSFWSIEVCFSPIEYMSSLLLFFFSFFSLFFRSSVGYLHLVRHWRSSSGFSFFIGSRMFDGFSPRPLALYKVSVFPHTNRLGYWTSSFYRRFDNITNVSRPTQSSNHSVDERYKIDSNQRNTG